MKKYNKIIIVSLACLVSFVGTGRYMFMRDKHAAVRELTTGLEQQDLFRAIWELKPEIKEQFMDSLSHLEFGYLRRNFYAAEVQELSQKLAIAEFYPSVKNASDDTLNKWLDVRLTILEQMQSKPDICAYFGYGIGGHIDADRMDQKWLDDALVVRALVYRSSMEHTGADRSVMDINTGSSILQEAYIELGLDFDKLVEVENSVWSGNPSLSDQIICESNIELMRVISSLGASVRADIVRWYFSP